MSLMYLSWKQQSDISDIPKHWCSQTLQEFNTASISNCLSKISIRIYILTYILSIYMLTRFLVTFRTMTISTALTSEFDVM